MDCDLHMHSRFSDGEWSVPELVRSLHQTKVKVFALTDHDTLEGLALAEQEAQRFGLRLINGVEISTRLDGIELHILGYGFDRHHPELLNLLEAQKRARRERIPQMVARLNELGLEIDESDVATVAGRANPGRPHVARALVQRGHVGDVDEAFRRYLGDEGPATVPKPMPHPKTAIRLLQAAGGKAVWAHPLARAISRPGGHVRMGRELAGQGLDGLEEVHPAHDHDARKHVRRLARELGLTCTGGSDFHGPTAERSGPGLGDTDVPASRVEALLA